VSLPQRDGKKKEGVRVRLIGAHFCPLNEGRRGHSVENSFDGAVRSMICPPQGEKHHPESPLEPIAQEKRLATICA